jgi:hypothetical protein
MKLKIKGIDHIYILCDKTYEPERYHSILNWTKKYFDPLYYSFYLYCYKHTIQEADIERYGIVKDRLKPSEISLIINNNKIFEDILDKHDSGNFLILESDVIPEPNWYQTLSIQMDKLTDKHFDFLHIGNGGNDSFLPTMFQHTLSNEPDIYKCPSGRCTEAIVWSYRGVQKYICSRNKPINVPFDFYLNIIASEDISSIDDSRTYWGHPVVFTQGKHYGSTVNDNINIPKRLTGYNNINVVVDPELMYIKEFIRKIIQQAYPEHVIIHMPLKQVHIHVTKNPISNKRCIIVNDVEIPKTKDILFQISNDFTNEKHFVPKICFSPYLTQLPKLIIPFRHFDKTTYDGFFFFNNTNNIVINLLSPTYKDTGVNSIFSFCYEDPFSPFDISDQILQCYLNNSIPIYKGCNVIIQRLFNPKTYINANDFPNEFFLYQYLENLCKNPDTIQQFFKEPVFLDNKIPHLFRDILNYFSNTLKKNLLK